jgi:hypothetical protein
MIMMATVATAAATRIPTSKYAIVLTDAGVGGAVTS